MKRLAAASQQCRLFGLGVCLLWLVGCATQPHRARQYSSAFDRLEPEQQQRLLRGAVSLGDTREMVYIALGAPLQQIKVVDADAGKSLERWKFLGFLKTNPEAEAGSDSSYVLYRTTNDFIVQNPFRRNELQVLVVDFEAESVVALAEETLAENPFMYQRPGSMTLPQSLHSPAPVSPVPDDSEVLPDPPKEPLP